MGKRRREVDDVLHSGHRYLYICIMHTDHVFGCAWHLKGAGMASAALRAHDGNTTGGCTDGHAHTRSLRAAA